MFPCVDEEDIRDYVANYKAYGQPSVDDYCSMPLLYVVCAIGADALATTKGMLTGYGQQYLQYTWKSLPAFLARPYRKSAQILLLMAIAFRGVGRSFHRIQRSAKLTAESATAFQGGHSMGSHWLC